MGLILAAIAAGMATGSLLTLWIQDLRRRVEAIFRPTSGRALRRRLCDEARRYLSSRDVRPSRYNRRCTPHPSNQTR